MLLVSVNLSHENIVTGGKDLLEAKTEYIFYRFTDKRLNCQVESSLSPTPIAFTVINCVSTML